MERTTLLSGIAAVAAACCVCTAINAIMPADPPQWQDPPTPVVTSTYPHPDQPDGYPPPDPVPTIPINSDAYFESCADAQEAGAAPLRRGQPGYRPGLDRDGDGVACEPER
jgi:hypothetical protein